MTKNISLQVVPSDIEGAEYSVCVDDNNPGCASIRVSKLSLYYAEQAAFRNVSLSIRPCAVTAIIGPSGCGKSSFLQCINRLSDEIPLTRVEGSIQIGQTDVLAKDCDRIALRKRVGMIFQRPTPFPFSIRKNFHLPLKEHGMRSKDEREATMEHALRAVGLWNEVSSRLQVPATDLSGGQQQRLCIARTLALSPEVLLMDEPCSALDPISARILEELIDSLRGKYTVVLVTHNLAQAKRLADDVAFFWQEDGAGVLVEHGASEQLFGAPQHELTSSYIAGLHG